MARTGARIPKALRPVVGGAVLVAGVRAADLLWRRIAGRPTPVQTREPDDARAGDPAVVRDRLVYALLLGGALRLARRAGLPAKDERAADAASEDTA